MGKQLTEVVATANARTSANRTFFPLVITGKRTPGRHSPRRRLAETAENPAGAGRPGVTKTCCATCRCEASGPRHTAAPLLAFESARDCAGPDASCVAAPVGHSRSIGAVMQVTTLFRGEINGHRTHR